MTGAQTCALPIFVSGLANNSKRDDWRRAAMWHGNDGFRGYRRDFYEWLRIREYQYRNLLGFCHIGLTRVSLDSNQTSLIANSLQRHSLPKY